jgi:hypothetical protein
VQGCLQHRVPTDYTNIAILNAGNLIVVGERLSRPDAAAEGRLRLDGILLYTAAFGIHEYCSPTYYGTDLSGLLMLHTLGQEPRERAQADALLKLFWTDIAANWLPFNEKMGGCNSRSYDYLRGIGTLDWQLWAQGWLHIAASGGKPPSAERRDPWGGEWTPPADIIALRDDHLPRFVEQRFGPLPAELRWHWIDRDISLSCAGASYGSQDAPLTIDLAGPRNATRCYFIADGREDPYGKKKYGTGAANHMKALHLQPFWTGAQKNENATGMVLYRPSDLREFNVSRLQSHIVLRRPTDGLWIAGDGVELKHPAGKNESPSRCKLPEGKSLVLRYGAMAVGIRVTWNYHSGLLPAPEIALVDDGNEYDALRLTVEHASLGELHDAIAKDAKNEVLAGAAFWVRVGNGLRDLDDLDRWRQRFESEPIGASPKLPCIPNQIMPSRDLPYDMIAAADKKSSIEPPDCVLRLNGREIGMPLLEAVEPLRSMTRGVGFWKPIMLDETGATQWRASDGLVLPGMKMQTYAGVPDCVLQEPSDSGQPAGAAWWKLRVSKAGPYYLWARVQSKDKQHGSFALTTIGHQGPIESPATWDLHSPGKWAWQPLRDAAKNPRTIELPLGNVLLELRVKASGTAIDRLWLGANAEGPGETIR